jgi:bifunctional glutamyl/prolyl-tRNA synthetase
LYRDLGEARSLRYLYDVFQDTIDIEVKKLLALKVDFKSATGIDWKPGVYASSTTGPAPNVETLSARIAQQGDRVRELNTQKASKVTNRTN